MKKVNIMLLAIKTSLYKMLEKSIENDKDLLKIGAEKSYADYATIKIVECSRSSYTKEAQKVIDEFAKEKGLEKVTTTYKRLEIKPIEKAEKKAEKILATLEEANDEVITKVASTISNMKK